MTFLLEYQKSSNKNKYQGWDFYNKELIKINGKKYKCRCKFSVKSGQKAALLVDMKEIY